MPLSSPTLIAPGNGAGEWLVFSFRETMLSTDNTRFEILTIHGGRQVPDHVSRNAFGNRCAQGGVSKTVAGREPVAPSGTI